MAAQQQTFAAVSGKGATVADAVIDYNTNLATFMAGKGTIWLGASPSAAGLAIAADGNNLISIVGQFSYTSAT